MLTCSRQFERGHFYPTIVLLIKQQQIPLQQFHERSGTSFAACFDGYLSAENDPVGCTDWGYLWPGLSDSCDSSPRFLTRRVSRRVTDSTCESMCVTDSLCDSMWLTRRASRRVTDSLCDSMWPTGRSSRRVTDSTCESTCDSMWLTRRVSRCVTDSLCVSMCYWPDVWLTRCVTDPMCDWLVVWLDVWLTRCVIRCVTD